MGNKNRASKDAKDASKSGFVPQEQDCYEGERLVRLLKLINGAIESAKLLDGNSLPEKFWFKQRFAIGVNEVTRVLERMSPTVEMEGFGQKPPPHIISTQHRKPTAVQLQAIVIAHDCNPKWLMKHLPSLASSRKVPVIFVKDGKKGSLRLGELVKLKTAIAIGVKVKDKGNSINQVVEEILNGGNEHRFASAQSKRGEIQGMLKEVSKLFVIRKLPSDPTPRSKMHPRMRSMRVGTSPLFCEYQDYVSLDT